MRSTLFRAVFHSVELTPTRGHATGRGKKKRRIESDDEDECVSISCLVQLDTSPDPFSVHPFQGSRRYLITISRLTPAQACFFQGCLHAGLRPPFRER